MIPGGLSPDFDRMPSLWVPLRAFLLGPTLGAAAGLVLVVAGSGALGSRWTAPVLASLHLITIGFLTVVMSGALTQVLPVVTGVPLPAAGVVAPLTHLGLGVGSVLMAAGLLGDAPVVSGIGAVVLAVGLAAFVASALSVGWRIRANPTGRAVVLSTLSLLVLGALGVALLAGHAEWLVLRRDLTDVHLAWALAGWVGLLVMGVSFQVVPMFQVTPSYPRWVERWLPLGVFAALTLWTVGRLADWTVLEAASLVGLVAALGGYATATLSLIARRRRKARDVTTLNWRLGMVSLLLAGVMLLGALMGLADLAAGTASVWFGVLVVMGFAVSVVQGMAYKIVPFLTWLHLQETAGSGVRVRNMRKLLPPAGPQRQFLVHVAAIVGLLVGSWLGGVWVAVAGVLLFADFAWLGLELAGVVARYRKDRRDLGA